MKYGICNLSIVPIRKEASEQSEMVSQLLFGEHFKINKAKNSWYHITTSYDNYEGWIDNKMLCLIDEETYNKLETSEKHYCRETTDIIRETRNYNSTMHIVLGSTLPLYKRKRCVIGNIKYICNNTPKEKDKNVFETALRYYNAPYLWGGRTPFGIDCSGFTQMVFKLNGIKLPRDAYQQAELGEDINIDEIKTNDLAFFENKEGKIIHVGIVICSNLIMHASGKVRIDILDEKGIYDDELKTHTHKLSVVKRIT